VTLTGLPTGAYRVELVSSDDVFIRSIRTPLQKLVAEGRLYLGDHVGYSDRTPPVTLIADGTRLSAATAHPEGLQMLSVDGRPLTVDAQHAAAHATLGGTRSPREVVSPKRDVVLVTDGVFALALAQYFDPLPFAVQWYTDEAALADAGVRYVLTTEEAPVRDGDASVATVSFDTSELAVTPDGAYRFVISAPGLDEAGRTLLLSSLRATLTRPPSSFMDAVRRLVAGPRRPPVEAGIANIVPNGMSFGENVP
jgi:hypothetical protein